jgi:hypothetical protein
MSVSCSASSARVSGSSGTARARAELELRQQGAERVAAGQLVGPVGGDDQDPLACHAASQERQRLAGRAVGPVEILDHQHHRALLPEGVEQRQQALEQPRLASLAGDRVPGQQRRHALAHRRGQRRVAVACERPQRRHQREVGQLALAAEVDGLAGQHERSRVARAAHQLSQQSRLPDARLAGDERQRRAPGGRVGERRFKLRQLGGATDQP